MIKSVLFGSRRRPTSSCRYCSVYVASHGRGISTCIMTALHTINIDAFYIYIFIHRKR